MLLQVLLWEVAVHPHACGENAHERALFLWRQLVHPHACGENARRSSAYIPDSPVHPHACGENALIDSPFEVFYGPPPRVWGKLDRVTSNIPSIRSTPTRVGKTYEFAPTVMIAPVHPHACGENAGQITYFTTPYGPPPRVWGKRNAPSAAKPYCRSTPTRVGKTYKTMLSTAAMAVHPHACGENHQRPRHLVDVIGPPPRVWGKRSPGIAAIAIPRSTPTRVGKTLTMADTWSIHPVHPHACGENAPVRPAGERVSGPPPRVWGKRAPPRRDRGGNSVHPHACGEN